MKKAYWYIVIILVLFYLFGFARNYSNCKTAEANSKQNLTASMESDVSKGYIKDTEVAQEKIRIDNYVSNNYQTCLKSYFSINFK